MDYRTKRIAKNALPKWITVIAGIAINVLLAFLAYKFKLPMFFDTLGTIAAAALGGVLPGVFVAVFTNGFCCAFNGNSLYFSIINVFVALCTTWFVQYGRFKKPKLIPIYILSITLFSAVASTLIQWLLLGGPQFQDVAEAAAYIYDGEGAAFFFACLLINTGLNLFEKGLSAGIVIPVIYFIPKTIRTSIWNSDWRQNPLYSENIFQKGKKKSAYYSLQKRLAIGISVGALMLAVILSAISIHLYFQKVKEEYTVKAQNAAKFAAEVVDAESVDLFIREGKSAQGYAETEEMLKRIHRNYDGIEYLYVVRIDSDACTFVFDTDPDVENAYKPGEKAPFEEAFEPYLPALFAGDMIDPIESNDITGWVMTAYYPIKDSGGITRGYAGADVSMIYMSSYVRGYLIKSALIFSSFFILLMSGAFTLSGYYLAYPITSMTAFTKDFVLNDSRQKTIDESVKRLSALDIRTGDEVEELYRSICKMESEMAEQMREIRHFAESTSKMQNGLIITMADMVENRDSDTGAHIQKTAAYVEIILKGLQKKGYYTEKLTPKFIADCVMSAPLHDVGKVKIKDEILNKNGGFEPWEYEIMKMHTTYGKEIIEHAISTVEGESYLKEARNMAGYHHERWDGKGYPEKLHGEVIPLSARVMAVADVFDALTSKRVYKPAFPLEKALAILEEGAGTQFDPKCVEVFMDSLPEVKKVLKKYNQDV